MFLGVFNTVFLNIYIYLPRLELRNRSIQIVVVSNFVVISNVGIKRFECIIFLMRKYFVSGFALIFYPDAERSSISSDTSTGILTT